MTEMTQYTPGTFCWVELATSDAAAAKQFYTQLFGWTFQDSEAGPGMVYTMLQLRGKDVGALYPMGPDQPGVPSHWNAYVSVESADDTAKRVTQLGGKVLMGPFDVMDVGRMATVQDPTGAPFMLWQPRKHIGALIVNEPGSFCWNELYTSNVDAAGRFYTELFGWQANAQQMGPMMYTVFMNAGRPNGGMLAITPQMKGMTPSWMAYFAVENCDRGVARAQELGAQLVIPPTDIPKTGRFAILQDPQQATFALIQLEPMP